MLHYRKIELSVEHKTHKQLIEKEDKEYQVGSSLVESEQIDNRGKVIIEYPQ